MFEKVLIAEDQESGCISVRKTLEDLGVIRPMYSYHCDDAFLHIKNALRDGVPYELLITDLSFEPDGRPQKLLTGEALISAARLAQPGLKILVFSLEKKPAIIDKLFKESGINGYVPKGRNDVQELKTAIASLFKNKQHFAGQLRQAVQKKNVHDFTTFDLMIVRLLSEGTPQNKLPDCLSAIGIKPNSSSSIEKRLKLIRKAYNFSNNQQLLVYCKEVGLT